MNCNKCGGLIQNGETVCPICGTPAVSEVSVPVSEPAVAPIAPVESSVGHASEQAFGGFSEPVQPVIQEQPVPQPVTPEIKPTVVSAPIDQMPQMQVSPMQQAVQASVVNEEVVEQPKKKNKKNIILIILILVIVIGCAIYGGYYVSKEKTEKEKKENVVEVKPEPKEEDEEQPVENVELVDFGNYSFKVLEGWEVASVEGEVTATSSKTTITYLVNMMPGSYDNLMASIDEFKGLMEQNLSTSLTFTNVWYNDQQFMGLFNDQYTIFYTRYGEDEILFFTFMKLPASYDEAGNIIEPVTEEAIMNEIVELYNGIVEKVM